MRVAAIERSQTLVPPSIGFHYENQVGATFAHERHEVLVSPIFHEHIRDQNPDHPGTASGRGVENLSRRQPCVGKDPKALIEETPDEREAEACVESACWVEIAN